MLNITVNHKFCSKHNHLFATNILMLSAYEPGIVLVFQECFCKVLVPWMGKREGTQEQRKQETGFSTHLLADSASPKFVPNAQL